MPKYKTKIIKAVCITIRKATVLKGRKFDNIFNKHFDRPTIVYCIVDTIYTVLAGINFGISEAACLLKKDPSLMLLVQSCKGEKFYKVLRIPPNIYLCVLIFDLQKKDDHQMSFSSHIEFHIAFFVYDHSKKHQKFYQYLARN